MKVDIYPQYGTVKQKMQDFLTRECNVQTYDLDILGLNRTVLYPPLVVQKIFRY
jgi:hypothetical protein